MNMKSNVSRNRSSNASITLVPGMDRVLEIQRPAVQAVADVNERLCEGIVVVNREWTTFLNRSLNESLLASGRLLLPVPRCRDVVRVYATIFQRACAHYQSGLEQMAQLNRTIAQDAMKRLWARTPNILGKVNSKCVTGRSADLWRTPPDREEHFSDALLNPASGAAGPEKNSPHEPVKCQSANSRAGLQR